jgi:hypothetical protein
MINELVFKKPSKNQISQRIVCWRRILNSVNFITRINTSLGGPKEPENADDFICNLFMPVVET